MNTATVPAKATLGDPNMIEMENGGSLNINLREDSHGRDRVALTLGQGCTLELSPHQARVLATELIMAVNRAEVRSNLKHNHNHNMTRDGDTGSQRRSLFHHPFAKQV